MHVHAYPRALSFYRKRHIPFGTSGHAFYRQVLISPPSFGTPTRNEVVESLLEISFSPFDRCATRLFYILDYTFLRCRSDNFLRARERPDRVKFGQTNFEDFHLPRTWGNGIDRGEPFVRAKAKASIRRQSGTE